MNEFFVRNSKRYDLDFWVTAKTLPGGGEGKLLLGFSEDGSLWVDPREFAIGPQHGPQLAQFPGGKYLLCDPAGGVVLINARAVALVMEDPDWRREWLASVDTLVQEWRKELAMRAAVPNN